MALDEGWGVCEGLSHRCLLTLRTYDEVSVPLRVQVALPAVEGICHWRNYHHVNNHPEFCQKKIANTLQFLRQNYLSHLHH